MYITCDWCGGTGKVVDWNHGQPISGVECEHCHGKGKIWVESNKFF